MWMALGVVLAAIELATPGGFVVVFFALAALAVGLLALVGLEAPIVQWLVFGAVAVLSLRVFRNPLLRRLQPRHREMAIDAIAGEAAIASTPMAPGEYGQAECRGSIWRARNVDLTPVAAGQRCRVVAVDGLLLDICSE
jgi:membrane protein implicated in regulation of membrane protease activity